MQKPTENRVLELTESNTDQRKAISRVVSAIKAATGKSFDDIYIAAHGSLEGRAEEDERSLPKGKIAHTKIAPIHRWIIDHYLPLACEIAPEVFDPSLLTRWRDFVRHHGIYDRLTIQFVDEMGLTQRSITQPVAERPIALGRPYLFHIDTALSATLLALEVQDGKTYPIALHSDAVSVSTPINAGQQTLPCKADGAPDPVSETEDKGLRCYIFVIAHPDIIAECTTGLHEAHPIRADKLDQIAFAFEGVDAKLFEVHRLNVIFK